MAAQKQPLPDFRDVARQLKKEAYAASSKIGRSPSWVITKIKELEDLGVVISGKILVRFYLASRPRTMEIIGDAVGVVRRYFPESQIILRYCAFPQHNGKVHMGHLVILATASRYDDDVLARIELVNSELGNLNKDADGFIYASVSWVEKEDHEEGDFGIDDC
ncbi:MAG: hypothetical protein KatS3mg054_0087 [Chloroflexus sp.]|nr:MAG: hypothetical protein KatS3mg054_0087 [Chloroflexus sp.]